jgi:hypothetical protein
VCSVNGIVTGRHGGDVWLKAEITG